MKSPITGKEMTLAKENRPMSFRKETFDVVFHYYLCSDSGEQFTTTELDEVNLNQIYNQYRDKHNIPFPDEIIQIREKYGLSAAKMSDILGFGINSYRQYESGEMPNISNARLIQMAADPKKFADMVALCDSIDDKAKSKLEAKIEHLIDEQKSKKFGIDLKKYLLGSHIADIYTGYRNPSLEKLTEMVVFFSEKLQPYKTKMNKLLFYADFLMFKQSCFSISGARYIAIDMGPVPDKFQSIYDFLARNDEIDICSTQFPQGYLGEQFQARTDRPFNAALFTDSEILVLQKVSDVFRTLNSNEIVEMSHIEEAWKDNITSKKAISYRYAFDLKQI